MKKLGIALTTALVLSMSCTVFASSTGKSFGDVPAAKSIKIDGDKEAAWDNALKLPIERLLVDGPGDDAKGTGYILCDKEFIYVLAEVKDPTKKAPVEANQKEKPWMTDSVEVFLDEPNEGAQALQYRIDRSGYPSYYAKGSTEESLSGADNVGDKFKYAAKETSDGYIAEFKIPFEKSKKSGDKVGFQMQVNDAQQNDAQDAIVLTAASAGEINSWDMASYDYLTLTGAGKSASDSKSKKDNPKTGVVGVIPFMMILAASGAGAVWSKRSKK